MKRRLFNSGLVVLALLLGWLAGATQTPAMEAVATSPVIVYQTEYATRNVQTTVYVPVPYEVERIVEVIRYKEIYVDVIHEVDQIVYVDKEVPTKLKEWESVAQFILWFRSQEFPTLVASTTLDPDCEDDSKRLQREAHLQGYLISETLVIGTTYYGVSVRDESFGHAACLVDIQGIYYYVEPNPNYFSITKIVDRD